MKIDSGLSSSASCASTPAVRTRSQTSMTTWRSSSGRSWRSRNAPLAAANDAAMANVPIQPWSFFGSARYVSAITRQPTSGASRITSASVVTGRSSLELPQLVDVDRQPPPVDRDDQAEPDRDLARGDDHDDQGEDLTVLVAVGARE